MHSPSFLFPSPLKPPTNALARKHIVLALEHILDIFDYDYASSLTLCLAHECIKRIEECVSLTPQIIGTLAYLFTTKCAVGQPITT